MHAYEQEVVRIINAVYEDARGYSLRDRDETDGELDDEPPLFRMKLACRNAENLILTDEVIDSCGLNWQEVETRLSDWISNNEGHEKHGVALKFQEGGYDRFSGDLKEIRNLLVGVILSSGKSWEVLVGKAIANLSGSSGEPGEHSVERYLGSKVIRHLLPD